MITTEGYGTVMSNFLNLTPIGYITYIDGVSGDIATQNQQAIQIFPNVSSIGFYTEPDGSHKVQIGGNMSATQVDANFISTASAGISTVSKVVSMDSAPYGRATGLMGGICYDGISYAPVNFPGRQMVSGGYLVGLDNSLPSQLGQATFYFQPYLSSLNTITGSYFTNSTSPGISHPIWFGNSTASNGLYSTIQVYGEENLNVFVSWIGQI
jgi:hypothetical protein